MTRLCVMVGGKRSTPILLLNALCCEYGRGFSRPYKIAWFDVALRQGDSSNGAARDRQGIEITNYPLEEDTLWSCFFESPSARSLRPTTLRSRVTIATTATIHRSNLARSIANSMSAAKKIERDVIRFVGIPN